jgi:uncharacterized membrane protein
MLKRFFKKHLPGTFLNAEETKKLAERVAVFEKNTGCELVFHFRRRLGTHPTEFNKKLFYRFKIDHTTGHRGILITLALVDRKFAVWADEGVAIHTGDKLWLSLCDLLGRDLKSISHIQALLNAVDHAESMLKDLAPLDEQGKHKEFKNELSNAPIIEGEDEN